MYHHSTRHQRIVVGVDGSAGSRAALVWAVREASGTAGLVEVVTVTDGPALYLDDLIGDIRAELGSPPAAIVTRVLRGDAADLLLDESAGARMLVVGRGGNGGIGPVSLRCVREAPCSVAVITG